jgi:hypothetical protein
MLLVIIALGAATVMTTGYLLSRRNSGAIGANASDSVSTRWASHAAAEQALAIMQTRADWRAQAMDGRLFENIQIGDALASAVITDLDGNSITGQENAVVLTAIARIQNISSATQWVVNVTPEPTIDNVVTPTLDEFSVYTITSLEAEPGSTIAVWDQSPYAALRPPVNIGTSAPQMSGLDISNSATLINSVAHLPPDAYSSLVSYAESSSSFVGANLLQTRMPIAGASKSFASTLTNLAVHPRDLRGNRVTTLASGNYGNIRAWLGVTLVLDEANGTYYAFDDLSVESYARLQIRGDVMVEVTDDLTIEGRASVELLTPDSSVTFLVNDDVEVRDSAIGLTTAVAQDAARDAFDITGYVDTSKIQILSQLWTDTSNSQQYTIDDSAILAASIHAPSARVEIRDDADLIGRVTADELRLRSGSTILYDSGLNPRLGITNPDGPLYATNGVLKTEFKSALETYDPAVGYELLTAYVESSVGDYDALVKDASPYTYDPDNLTPRFSHTAWVDTWPTNIYAFESHILTPTNTIDGVLIQPTFDITDLLVEPTGTTQVIVGGTGGTGTGGSRSTMTFVEETDPLAF